MKKKRTIVKSDNVHCGAKEACRILKVSRMTLQRLIDKSQIPYFYDFENKNIHLVRFDLEKFVEQLPTKTKYTFPTYSQALGGLRK